MNIAVSGASGFIGSYIVDFFYRQGYGVIPLTREILQNPSELKQCLQGCEVVINLAGAPINHRWSLRYKHELIESRIETTMSIVAAVNESDVKPELLISASAVGIYPSQGCYAENSDLKGEGFLAVLCREWEEASRCISPIVRVVNPRFGIVLSFLGGAFPKMTRGARRGILAIPGSGRQILSWIALEDLARAMEFIIKHRELEGAINFTAPEMLTYGQFAHSAANHLHSICSVRIPAFVFRVFLGEASVVLLSGQCALPDKLLHAGFSFQDKSIEDFLSRSDL